MHSFYILIVLPFIGLFHRNKRFVIEFALVCSRTGNVHVLNVYSLTPCDEDLYAKSHARGGGGMSD
jgi:hypothetical protein